MIGQRPRKPQNPRKPDRGLTKFFDIKEIPTFPVQLVSIGASPEVAAA